MRLKLSFLKDTEHADTVCCIGWSTSEEFFSCGDDHVLLKWNLVTGETQKVCTLPSDLYPIDFNIFSRVQSLKRQGQDHILITSSDGRFHLLGKNGRIEKSVEAHKGAVLVGQWSPDGSGLLTGGEDGQIKIWSRSGMLRSTVSQGNLPVYTAHWSSDSTAVLYAQGKMLVIKPLAPNTKPNRWKGHDGLILKVAWDHVNGFIVSGGEDCRYKVWDGYGRQMYSSIVHEYPLTSLAWAPNGEMFAIGSYNTLRLCDRTGWSHCLEKPSTGSLYCIAWSSDSTQLAAASANRKVLVAHLIERGVEWGAFEAVARSRRSVTVRDVTTEAGDDLEFQERVTHLALAYGHLLVLTPAQCYIYSLHSLNTPIVLDLRDGSVSNLVLSEKHLLLVEKSSLNVYSYEGRLMASPRWASLNPPTLNPLHLSLAPDALAVRDQADERVVQLFDINGKEISGPFQHSTPITEVGLSQAHGIADRLLAFVDKNRDLFLAGVLPKPTQPRKVDKLGGIVQSFKWNSHLNILAAMQDTSLVIWYHPLALFVDDKLVRKTSVVRESGEFGRSPSVVSFVNNQVGIRRSDGALVYSPLSPYVSVLHGYAASSSWSNALRLCRMVKENDLWACLAVMATHAKDLGTAELAYAAINHYDKVVYIQHIKSIPLRAVQIAEMYLLGGNVHEAETLLLQNGLVFRAIWSNINTHNWNRALEIAVRHKVHIDTVLLFRKRYLEGFEKSETNERFLQLYNKTPMDEAQIDNKVAMELQREKWGDVKM